MLDKLIDKGASKLSSYSSIVIVSVTTIIVVSSSPPLVYWLCILFGVQYTSSVFVLSVVAPLMMVPPTIVIVIKLSKHLKYFKDALEQEVKNGKKKDILLYEQSRFSLMGEMMANISHQWKQPLNTIGIVVASAKLSNPSQEELDNYFNIMEKNVNYLASTINDFMSFFDKRTSLDKKNIKDIVQEINSIMKSQIEIMNIKLSINTNNIDVEIASSITQVLLNLINNSKDALEAIQGYREIQLDFIHGNNALEITCCDNGSSIMPKIKKKIFDPYFTTKDKAQGTGLGLYMSKEIIQKIFNGKINVALKSEDSQNKHTNKFNTCFYINIPYSDKCVLQEVKR